MATFQAVMKLKCIFLLPSLLYVLCHCKEDYCEPYDYYQKLESALVSDQKNLYKLQQLFFPTGKLSPDKTPLLVCTYSMTDQPETPSHSINTSSATSQTCWDLDWNRSLLYGIFTQGQIYVFENIVEAGVFDSAIISSRDDIYKRWIKLKLGNFSCKAQDNGLFEAVITLTSWFKAYAKASGRPQEWKQEDKGYVTKSYGHWNVDGVDDINAQHVARCLLLFMFIILNLTVTLLLLRLVPRYYSHLIKTLTECSSPYAVDIFWAFVLLTVGWNALVHIYYSISFGFLFNSIRAHSFKTLPSTSFYTRLPENVYRDALLSCITKVLTVTLAVVVHFLLAVCTSKTRRYPIPSCFAKLCCCCGCLSNSARLKIIQTIALWNILLFIQFIAMAAIPVFISFLLAPARTVTMVATITAVIASLLVVTAHLLEFANVQKRNSVNQQRSLHWKYQCIQLFTIIAVFTLVILVLLSYQLLLLKGASIIQGVYGFVWSLFPSFMLSVVGWYIKWKILPQRNLTEVFDYRYSPLETDSDTTEDTT